MIIILNTLFRDLPELVILEIGKECFSSLLSSFEICNYPKLEKVIIGGSSFRSIQVMKVSNLQLLKTLQIFNSNSFTNLTSLSLDSNYIVVLFHIIDLPSFKVFIVTGNSFTKLRSLSLSSTLFIKMFLFNRSSSIIQFSNK